MYAILMPWVIQNNDLFDASIYYEVNGNLVYLAIKCQKKKSEKEL